MKDERFKQIMEDFGMPNSRSLLLALQQVANEVSQECRNSTRFSGNPYLVNRGDGVDGHYCMARYNEKGFHEFWNDEAKAWLSAGTVFNLGRSKKPSENMSDLSEEKRKVLTT